MKAVHFGAGKIGRGFIADLLHDTGYEITFVDVNEKLNEELNKYHNYYLYVIEEDYKRKEIDKVSALSPITQKDDVTQAIVDADLVTTAVLADNFPKIAANVAAGLKTRLDAGKEKVNVIPCENALFCGDMLKAEVVKTGIITEEEIDQIAIIPNTAVDRMVFDGHHHGKDGIEVGDAFELPVEKNKLEDPESEPVKGAEYVDDLAKFLQRKIYMVNCAHAVTSYFGFVKGYSTVQEGLADTQVLEDVKKTVMESASALEKIYGFAHEDLVEYMNSMIIKRFTTPGVSDPIARVAREPIRKISANDRIMGPAIQCEELGLDNSYLLKGAACAMFYKNEEDAQAVELQNYIKENGPEAAVVKYIGLKPEDRMTKVIVEEYNKLV